MEQHVVVGIDGTSAGRAAIRWGLERAARLHLDVDLVHVVDDGWGVVGEQSLEELHPEVDDLLRASLAFARDVAPGVRVTARLLTGDPMVELAEASRDAEIVVVGTNKTGFIHGRAFGSRSLQLAGMALRPVAVIPESSFGSRSGVLVGVDDSEAGRAAIAFGAAEAESSRQPLTFIRGLGDGVRGPHSSTAPSPDDERVGATADTPPAELAKVLGFTGPVRSRIIERPAAEALVDAASMSQLLVLGSSRRHGAQLAALGPVCHDVLLNIASPTVIVHGDLAPQPIGPNRGATTA
jgi:nucleotide-binding universal stress UspA family protein